MPGKIFSMTDAYSIWNPINLVFSENFLQATLILNVMLTLFLVFQNLHIRKLMRGRTLAIGSKGIIETHGGIPPFIDETDETLANSPKKQTADIDLPKIERAIKMIKNGYSQEEIINAVDIENAYISILQLNHKVSER
jgi:hypothetical protein